MSLLNGLSQMGQGLAQFASTAGLAQQKAALEMQQTKLANQLVTNRELNVEQPFQAAQAAMERQAQENIVGQQTQSAQKVAGIEGASRLAAAQAEAGAELGVAGINAQTSRANNAAMIAAQAPLVKAETTNQLTQAGIAGTNLQLAQKSLDISMQIVAEAAKPPSQQDGAKIAALTNERLQLGMTPDVMAKVVGSLDGMVRATQQEATEADAAVARVMGQEANLNMGDPKVRATQEAELAQVTAQRDAIYQRLNTLTSLAQSYLPKGQTAGAPPPPGAAKSIDLNQFLRQPNQAAPATAAGPASGPRPGLINAPTAPVAGP